MKKLIAVCALASCLYAHEAAALSLGPGLFKVQHVEPGKPLNLRDHGVLFKVKNDTDTEQEYTITASAPGKAGLPPWERGYDEFPDGAWCKLEKTTFKVPPKTTEEIGMTIDIPAKPENYNCKWIVAIVLNSGKSGPGRVGAALAVASRVQIETARSDDAATGGAAAIATVASVVQVSGKPGDAFERTVKLRNNTKGALNCVAEPLQQVYADDPAKFDRYRSTAFQYPKETMLQWPKEKFELAPEKFYEFKLSGKIPASAKDGEKWEELVFISVPLTEAELKERPNARVLRTFFRVQVEVGTGNAK